MELPADPGLTMTAYSAEPGTPSEDALRLLATCAATLDEAKDFDAPGEAAEHHLARRATSSNRAGH